MMGNGMMDFGLGWFSLLTMLLFWGGLLAIAIWLVGLLFPKAQPHPHHDHKNSAQK